MKFTSSHCAEKHNLRIVRPCCCLLFAVLFALSWFVPAEAENVTDPGSTIAAFTAGISPLVLLQFGISAFVAESIVPTPTTAPDCSGASLCYVTLRTCLPGPNADCTGITAQNMVATKPVTPEVCCRTSNCIGVGSEGTIKTGITESFSSDTRNAIELSPTLC